MPGMIKYDPTSDVALQVWTGSMSKDEWSKLAIGLAESPLVPNSPRVVVDISGAEWDNGTTEADIEDLLAHSMHMSQRLVGAQIAIITPSDWRKAMLVERVVERLQTPMAVIVFHRLLFACQWLDLDVATTAGELARMKWGPTPPEGAGTGST